MYFLAHYLEVFHSFARLQFLAALAAEAVFMSAGIFLAVLHEGGHMLAARLFAIRGRLVFFPRRGKTKLWFLSVLGVQMNDAEFLALPPWQCRVIAAAGPCMDLAAACLLFAFGLDAAGPAWLGCGLAMVGAVYLFPCCLQNILPIKALRNDGWLVLFPRDAV